MKKRNNILSMLMVLLLPDLAGDQTVGSVRNGFLIEISFSVLILHCQMS